MHSTAYPLLTAEGGPVLWRWEYRRDGRLVRVGTAPDLAAALAVLDALEAADALAD
jgi:hypothetical protein